MKVLQYIWIAVQVLIGYNLVFPVLLLLINWVRGNNGKKASGLDAEYAPENPDYALIVTAYENTDQLPDVVDSLTKLNYGNFLIYIVADKCDISTLFFADERVVLLKPEEVLASNTGSHFYAINRFRRPHTHLAIIDSDNLVHPEFLRQLTVFFKQGFKAVQGLRDAKNLNTTYACLDAARDIYYHYYDGKMLFGAGSSATLSGSGMAFTTALYRECLEQLDVSGAGFDKVLQNAIVSRGNRIAFSGEAIVYDEKTTGTDQLVKQRARWINTWFRYFSYGFGLVGKGIMGLNWNQFLFGFVLLRPPLFIFLLLSVAFLAVNLLFMPVAALYWFISLVLFVVGFFLALLNSPTDKRIYSSLKGIPAFMFFQILSLLKAKKANKISVATKHTFQQDPSSK